VTKSISRDTLSLVQRVSRSVIDRIAANNANNGCPLVAVSNSLAAALATTNASHIVRDTASSVNSLTFRPNELKRSFEHSCRVPMTISLWSGAIKLFFFWLARVNSRDKF